MSSNNAQSAVTYTSISSDSDGPSWGIPLINAGEFLEMDPYKEIAQQGQVHPLSSAYVPDPIELNEHVPVHVPEPEHPEYRAPSDDDIQIPMAASTHALIDAFAAGSSLFPLPPTSPAYDQAQLESSAAAAARAPRSQYKFVNTVEAGHCLVHSYGHNAWTIARAADKAEDIGYVKALQASKQRMMTSIKEVNLRVSYQAQVRRQESKYFYTKLHDAQTNRRDIRLEIDVVRGQRTAYETELQEVHQAYLSFEAQNRALLARLETLETHMSRMKWQRQSAEDLTVTQMMRIHTLEARARTDTVEDTDSSY
nr:hypothetical protein [Tanacetum cinerariifolium]